MILSCYTCSLVRECSNCSATPLLYILFTCVCTCLYAIFLMGDWILTSNCITLVFVFIFKCVINQVSIFVGPWRNKTLPCWCCWWKFGTSQNWGADSEGPDNWSCGRCDDCSCCSDSETTRKNPSHCSRTAIAVDVYVIQLHEVYSSKLERFLCCFV